ncbi:HAMP domain-containing histidine kinase [Vibrio sp. D404a]|uniref:sensor histidine kinase n=1 Tax=unclassified Vibrio TaxID=2614977 RepID=UPI0025554DC0|nr:MULTISPECIES: HAMP domain-containing sensor histidine kinase [unclassified Vibrio]MDK9738417.1 HAMP domain-containing histidine kinase [Vibrio sp. D404a]MDK9796219.1 HAMP domain-containing histidine kinase [Vibrio sp. D449a]
MSFKSRLVAFTSIWFLLASVAIGFTYHWQKQTIEQRTKQSLHKDLAHHMRDDNPLMVGTDYNPVALKSIFHTLMLIGPDFEIYFLDAQGKITTHAAPEGTQLQEYVDLEPIHRFLSNEAYPILGEDPRTPEDPKVFSVAAIQELGSTVGYLYVLIGSNRHAVIADAQVDSSYIALAALVLISILGFAIGAYMLVKRSLLNPIQQVTDKLQQQAEHDFRLEPDFTKQVPELVPVARSYELMAKHIQQQFLHLEYQSSQRRQTLIQLSHDLKTPLSSVLGYLETWQLQHPESDPLIDVAYRNSNKLFEQLNSLLDTAKQEKGLPTYEYRTIDFNHLLTLCEETFKNQLTTKRIMLNVKAEDSVSIVGEQNLIERLMFNLMENAIRHAPQDSELNIVVEQGAQDKRIRVTIENQVDNSAAKGSLGIGTRIVQSILMLHHSVLETTKADNTFKQSFYLPSAHIVG